MAQTQTRSSEWQEFLDSGEVSSTKIVVRQGCVRFLVEVPAEYEGRIEEFEQRAQEHLTELLAPASSETRGQILKHRQQAALRYQGKNRIEDLAER